MAVMTLPAPVATVAPVAYPRRPLWQRLSWLGVLAAGIVAYVVVLRVMIDTQNVSYFPSLLLIGSITVPVTVLVFAATGGRREVIPNTGLLVFTAVVGGLIGILAAGVVEYDTLAGLAVIPMLAVGLIEETAKLLVPFAIFLFARRRDPREGILIGIATGMGFATLETMGYGFQVLLAAHSITAVDTTLLVRAVTAPAGHIAWTGMTVAMLWRIRTAQHRGRAVAAFVATFAVAVALHAAWDSVTSIAMGIVVAATGLVGLLVLLHLAHRVPGPMRLPWRRSAAEPEPPSTEPGMPQPAIQQYGTPQPAVIQQFGTQQYGAQQYGVPQYGIPEVGTRQAVPQHGQPAPPAWPVDDLQHDGGERAGTLADTPR
ncbi:PrsW family glutamic-type intramembrane protease [Actinotalea sp. M2MS4P-6]|uniref:PrsW family intramembrane metalloprotease n=1 Tax=Actinotalea sp. M2MS4P-6 TaxID=2983762 RepID=UPI0021E47524|nr:PrsW family glutamic-type intramembrane protease [Actinotalea sp. M2MS4P-6]MCV2393085.1 PrsW family glutamic-type intramembrane protease [Actinotalea sp. M2MS4P-6]